MHCNAFTIFTCDSNQDFLPNQVCCYFRAFRYVLATNVAFCSIVNNLNIGEQHTGFHLFVTNKWLLAGRQR